MNRAMDFARRSERLAKRRREPLSVKLDRMAAHAERIQALDSRVVTDAERQDAMDMVWAAFAITQSDLDQSPASEFFGDEVEFVSYEAHLTELLSDEQDDSFECSFTDYEGCSEFDLDHGLF